MAEDTLTKETATERENLIAEMLRDAKRVELPSELTKEPVISRGEETAGAPTIVREISSAGYVYVWDTRTYDKVPVLYYRLPQVLRQRRPDGSYQFTTRDPGRLPIRGAVKCLLHKDDKNRAHYTELGFRVCPKENLPNLYQLRRHMMLRHSQEWAAIELERQEKERAEDRALQRLLLAQQLVKQEEPPKESAAALQPEREPQETDGPPFLCDICKADFGSKKTMREHRKTHK